MGIPVRCMEVRKVYDGDKNPARSKWAVRFEVLAGGNVSGSFELVFEQADEPDFVPQDGGISADRANRLGVPPRGPYTGDYEITFEAV